MQWRFLHPITACMQPIWTKETILIFVFPDNRVACMTGKCMLPVQRKEGHVCVCACVLTASYSFLPFSVALSLSLSLSLRHSKILTSIKRVSYAAAVINRTYFLNQSVYHFIAELCTQRISCVCILSYSVAFFLNS